MPHKSDTDFSQLQDAVEFKRRASDRYLNIDCDPESCSAVYLLSQRMDRHREDINAIKASITTNGENITEVLDIVSTAKSFFRAMGWIGDKLKPIIYILSVITSFIVWIKYGSPR